MINMTDMINWKEVADELRKLVSGKNSYSRVESAVNEQMTEIIKKKWPDNYQEVIKANRGKLLKIRAKLTEKFFRKIKEEILAMTDPYN